MCRFVQQLTGRREVCKYTSPLKCTKPGPSVRGSSESFFSRSSASGESVSMRTRFLNLP